MAVFSVPNRPAGGATRDIAQIIADFDAMATDYETKFAAYSDISNDRTTQVMTNATHAGAGTFIMGSVGVDNAPGSGGSQFTTAFWLDPADYPSAGRTVKLRTRAWALVNATVPAVNFVTGLYSVTGIGGGAGAGPTVAALAAVTAGSTAAINAPAASVVTKVDGADFTCPAAGLYVLAFALSAAIPVNSNVVLFAKLQMRHSNP